MLDAYIKIEDIRKLLDEVESTNGLIKRSDFQKDITKLTEYRKPKKENTSPGYRSKINNIGDIIGNITRHQNNTRSQDGKNVIKTLDEVANIMGISRNTAIKLKKEGIIKRFFYLNGIGCINKNDFYREYPNEPSYRYFYSLIDIKRSLIVYRSMIKLNK